MPGCTRWQVLLRLIQLLCWLITRQPLSRWIAWSRAAYGKRQAYAVVGYLHYRRFNCVAVGLQREAINGRGRINDAIEAQRRHIPGHWLDHPRRITTTYSVMMVTDCRLFTSLLSRLHNIDYCYYAAVPHCTLSATKNTGEVIESPVIKSSRSLRHRYSERAVKTSDQPKHLGFG